MSDHSSDDPVESGSLEPDDDAHPSGEPTEDAAEGEPYTEQNGT
jgi:hypothetical protein